MKTTIKLLVAALLLAAAGRVLAEVHYVDVNSTNRAPPYTNWTTAAANIQDAVDAAAAGDEIVVTNGIYSTGERNGNRVAVDKPLAVRSVNGPQFTVIKGFQVPGATNDYGAIRCVYLANGSSLSGFTLTNGATLGYLSWDFPSFSHSSGGGLWCESTNGVMVSNCVMTGNSAYHYGGGVYSGTLYNCTLTGNSARYGGGAYQCRVINSTLTSNSAGYYGDGGGASNCELNGCTLSGNSAASSAYQSTLNNCTVSGNSRDGANSCTLTNCVLTGNAGYGAASSTLNRCQLNGNLGGGAYGCGLNNCALTGNYNAGGAQSCFLTNCTLTGNSGNVYNAGGASYSTLNNCIAYFNTGGNYSSCTLDYCCTTPQPASGVGNISVDPLLVSAWHLHAASPCRGAGALAETLGTDIDGESWANPPSIGCDEFYAGAVTRPLSVAITAPFTNVSAGFTIQLTALVEGSADSSSWNFGDGTAATNQPYTAHAWALPGNYSVVLRASNETQPGGITATVTVHVVSQPIHYVAADSGNPVVPYTSWATAATNIQDAVDAATVPGALVLVTNGAYASGGRMENRVMVDKPLNVRSVNGPRFTAIDGGQLNRCVSLTNVASISGFTVTNAYDGAFGGTLNNCVLSGNTYGADYCTLNNCALIGNGYGASFCTLNNCTLTGNTYDGAQQCAMNNCIAYFNGGANYDPYCTLNSCCATPQPLDGVGNNSMDPQLASGWRLSADSPCRGAGSASYPTGADIDGEPWMKPPSIGCDEYYLGGLTGTLSIRISTLFTNVAPGFVLQFTALIEGRAAASSWDFGDGITITNQPYTSHAWTALGDYGVVLRAYNESWPGGISATTTVHVVPGIHYVAAGGTNPVAPYTSWQTAAMNIQDAINAAIEPGAQVLVTDGSYAPIQVPALLSVRSANGPSSTSISGRRTSRCASLASGASLSGFTLTLGFADRGAGVWCESQTAVVSNCVISGNKAGGRYGGGFTYYVGSGGGAYGGTLNNCTLIGNSVTGYHTDAYFGNTGAGYGGGAYNCTLNNCVLSGNSAFSDSYSICDYWCSGGGIPYCCHTSVRYTPAYGGGAYQCTLNNCTVSGNLAFSAGGGAVGGTLNNCKLTGNLASEGGGTYGSTLENCTLTGNSNSGASSSTLNRCTISSNSGVGASHSTLNNSALIGNSDAGAISCALNNCTLTGNSGGGARYSTLNNCIAYFNTSTNGANYDSSCILNNSCTTPQPTNGVGNISSDPQLVSFWHVGASSSCRGAGNGANATGTDIDGEAWLNPPSMGCDEYHAGALTGPLSVEMTASFTTVTRGVAVQFTGLIEGRTTGSVWDFGDGTTVTNQPYTSHAWTALGDYAVVLRASNESWPGGISATTTVHVVEGVHYVAAGSANPIAPFTSWGTAATNIQDGVDAAVEPGAQVVVTNGSYASGGRATPNATNRVVVDRGLTVRSVNGPRFTIINGGQSNRCVSLASGAILMGFTLTNGSSYSGGGVSGGILNNCTLSGNSAWDGGGAFYSTLNNCRIVGNSAWDGGGAQNCTLNNCTIAGNSATNSGGGGHFSTLNSCALTGNFAGGGGGANSSTLNNCVLTGNAANYGGGTSGSLLNNCTVTGNSASHAGGVHVGTQRNCVIYFNNAGDGPNYSGGTLSYSCTTPDPFGIGNITNAPLFVNLASGNLRLQSNSPGINAALNASAPVGPDLDGNPRIVGGTVDIGAYEYQSLDLISSGVASNQFGFNVTGQSNWVIVLEASSNFTHWTALTTNTLNGSPFPFRDPTPRNLPQRFYRARHR